MSVEELIAGVYRRRSIWDPTDPSHKNVGVLKREWRELSLELRITEKNVKKKWKNLRDYFRQELKKEETLKAGGSAVGSTWPHFNQMLFLKDAMRRRVKSEFFEQDMALGDGSISSLTGSPFEQQDVLEPERKRMRAEMELMLANNQASISMEEKKMELVAKDSIREEDDDLLFFKSVIPHMKLLSPIRKLRLRSAIQELVVEEIERAQHDNDIVE